MSNLILASKYPTIHLLFIYLILLSSFESGLTHILIVYT